MYKYLLLLFAIFWEKLIFLRIGAPSNAEGAVRATSDRRCAAGTDEGETKRQTANSLWNFIIGLYAPNRTQYCDSQSRFHNFNDTSNRTTDGRCARAPTKIIGSTGTSLQKNVAICNKWWHSSQPFAFLRPPHIESAENAEDKRWKSSRWSVKFMNSRLQWNWKRNV